MIQRLPPGRQRLHVADIGGWLFRCNPHSVVLDPGSALIDSRCAVRTYRLDLICPGHPVVLWLTGPTRATPAPGVYMAGYATGDVVDDTAADLAGPRRVRVVLSDMMLLSTPVPRADLAIHPATASMEVLRQPFGPNPSYLTPAEQLALRYMMGGWPGEARRSGSL